MVAISRLPRIRLFLIALIGVSISACNRQCPSVGADTDVVLIDLSGCRPDRMHVYGYERLTTPTLSELAEESSAVIFRNHHVASPSTGPSVASLMTGLLPSRHRSGDVAATSGRPGLPAIDPQRTTLAESLSEHGFETYGIVSSASLSATSGFDRGFAHYLGPDDLTGNHLRTAKAYEALTSERNRNRPVFVYLQLDACTDPYPANLRDQDYLRAHKVIYGERRRRMLGIDFQSPRFGDAFAAGKIDPSAADTAFLELIYESKMYFFDRHILGPFLRQLRETKAFDRTMFVITSSHGQELFDHDGYGSGHALWRELTSAPLVIKFPRLRRPSELRSPVDHLTGTIDLFPTIACAVGADIPSDLLGQQIILGQHRDWVVSETPTARKLVTSEYSLYVGAAGTALFDRNADPLEQTDLATEHTATVDQLESRLTTLLTSNSPPR